MTAKRIGVAVAPALVVPFVISALFRVGLPGPTPFVVVLAGAAACWFRENQPLAIGVAVGAAVWAVALTVILNSMGDGIGTIG